MTALPPNTVRAFDAMLGSVAFVPPSPERLGRVVAWDSERYALWTEHGLEWHTGEPPEELL